MDFIRLDLTTVLLPPKLWTPSHQVCRESRQLLTHLYLHSTLPVRCQHITSIASYNQQHYSGRLEKTPDITSGTLSWKMTRNLKLASYTSVWVPEEMQAERYTVANPLQKGQKLLCSIWPLHQGLLPGAVKQSWFQEWGTEWTYLKPVFTIQEKTSMNVLTTELQQSNGADDNDVHKRGKGD